MEAPFFSAPSAALSAVIRGVEDVEKAEFLVFRNQPESWT